MTDTGKDASGWLEGDKFLEEFCCLCRSVRRAEVQTYSNADGCNKANLNPHTTTLLGHEAKLESRWKLKEGPVHHGLTLKRPLEAVSCSFTLIAPEQR